MATLYAQASNMFITSQEYQKWSGYVIPGNSCRCCSVYNLQIKTEHGLIKSTLISSVSNFSLRVEILLGEISPWRSPRGVGTEFSAPCVAWRKTRGYLSDTDKRIFRLNTYNKSCQLVMGLTGFVCANTRSHRKTLREIKKKRQKQKPTKNQMNTKYRNTT